MVNESQGRRFTPGALKSFDLVDAPKEQAKTATAVTKLWV